MAKRGPPIKEDGANPETQRKRAQDRARQLRARAKKAAQSQLNAQQLQISANIGTNYGSLAQEDAPPTNTSLGLRAAQDIEDPLPTDTSAQPDPSPVQSPILPTTILEHIEQSEFEYIPFRRLNRESDKSPPPLSPSTRSQPDEFEERPGGEEKATMPPTRLHPALNMTGAQTLSPLSHDLCNTPNAPPRAAEPPLFDNAEVANDEGTSFHDSDSDTGPFAYPIRLSLSPSGSPENEEAAFEQNPIVESSAGPTSPHASTVIDDPTSSEEHSESSDAEDSRAQETDSDAEEPSLLRYGVDKVYHCLYRKFHGCTKKEHAKAYKAHLAETDDPENHYSLRQIHEKPLFTSVLEKHDHKQQPAFTFRHEFGRQEYPTSDDWQATFEGTQAENPDAAPMQLCLHRDHIPENGTNSAVQGFDIDSFLGFATSLAVARQGINIYPAPLFTQNMKTDVHIAATHVQDDTPSSIMLKEIPHFRLGDIVGFGGVELHILFPHLRKNPIADHFSRLTNEQLDRFINRVLLPAAYDATPSDYHQHLPASFRVAYANSRASQKEGRLTSSMHYLGQHAIHHHLQAQYLDEITEAMRNTVQTTPGLRDFRDFMLFFSKKNTKLAFKRRTPLESMQVFNPTFQHLFDPAYIIRDRCWIDVAKEICPNASYLPTDPDIINDDAQVYLFRRCCASKYLRHLYDGINHKSASRLFHNSMLQDAVGLTNLVPKSSKLYRAGVIYDQVYTSWKASLDASKSYPFQNESLESMAVDPSILRGVKGAGSGGARGYRGRDVAEHAYLSSKERLRISLLDAGGKSFGWRHEQRCSLPLYEGLYLRLEEDALLGVLPPPLLVPQPTCCWAVKTSTFLPFLARQANKYATGFEYMRARCPPGFVTWEQTKMMAMFLRCLRFSLSGHQLARESALWKESAESRTGLPPVTRVWHGLGFQSSLARYGYCWIRPGLIDWTRLHFCTDLTDNVLFGNQAMKFAYLQKGGQARDFFQSTLRTELALNWLRHYEDDKVIRDRMLEWLGHLCLQQLRADIFKQLQKEIPEESWPEMRAGDFPLNLRYIKTVSPAGIRLTKGNRAAHKKVKPTLKLLWDFDDGSLRSHWHSKPFRVMFERICLVLRENHVKTSLEAIFRHRFWWMNLEYHWVLPNFNSHHFVGWSSKYKPTDQVYRTWISIRKGVQEPDSARYSIDHYVWARDDLASRRPDPVYPRYLLWDRNRWEAWVNGRLGPEHTVVIDEQAEGDTVEQHVVEQDVVEQQEAEEAIQAYTMSKEAPTKPKVIPPRRSHRLHEKGRTVYQETTEEDEAFAEDEAEEEENELIGVQAPGLVAPEDRVVVLIPRRRCGI
jgi:hypothetical protein